MAGYLLLSDPRVSPTPPPPSLYLLYLQEVELRDKQRAERKQQILRLHTGKSNHCASYPQIRCMCKKISRKEKETATYLKS